VTTARFTVYTAGPLALVALFAALQTPALFLWYAALIWFAFGCGGIAAGYLMRDQRDRAREELARREREEGAVEPCPTCSWPSRETVGLVCQTCGTDYNTYAANPPADLTARMVDLARAAEEARPDLRIVGPTPPAADEAWLDEITKPDGWVG
jgi:hypothetical protein